MQHEKSKYELLREKNILAILDGDTDFGFLEINGENSNIKVSMPYLSGPMLCDMSNKFGLPVTYAWNGGAQSRWAYMDDLLAHCIQNGHESDLLSFLFSKGQFTEKLRGQTPETIDYAYSHIVKAIINQINGILYFSGNELVQTGSVFVIQKIGTTISVAAPSVTAIDRRYITDISERAMKDISDGNYDSAITKSRTLVEEVFCYVIEKKGVEPSESGDMGKLYNQVKQIYNMKNKKKACLATKSAQKPVTSCKSSRNTPERASLIFCWCSCLTASDASQMKRHLS